MDVEKQIREILDQRGDLTNFAELEDDFGFVVSTDRPDRTAPAANFRPVSGVVFGYTPTSYETTAVSTATKVNQERAEATRIGCETRKTTRTKKVGTNVCLGYTKTDYQTTAQARNSTDLWGEKCVQEKGNQKDGRAVSIILGSDAANYQSTAKSANQTDINAMRKSRQEAMAANDKFKSAIKKSSISFDTNNPTTDYSSSTSMMFNSVNAKSNRPESTNKNKGEKPMTSADFRKANFTLGSDASNFVTESRRNMIDPGDTARAEFRNLTKAQHLPTRGMSNIPIAHG